MRKKIPLFVLLLAGLVGLFIILEPKLSALTFAQTRKEKWETFVADVKNTNEIDGKKFWEFRETYSPGHFVFAREGIPSSLITSKLANMGLPSDFLTGTRTVLVYDSPYIGSSESLVDTKTARMFYKKFPTSIGKSVAKGDNFLLVQKGQKVLLFSILPQSEMLKANGFFDSIERDKELIKGMNWLIVSQIILD